MEINQKQNDRQVGDLNQQLHNMVVEKNNMVAEKGRLDAKIMEVKNNILKIDCFSNE